MSTEEALAQTLGIPYTIAQDTIGPYSINYFKAGQGRPLLLIHGANIGWGQWYRNIPELAKRFEVWALDLPGAGRSSRVDYSKLDPQKDLVEVVEKFVRVHNLRDFHIIGASIGGWIALQMALRNPNLLNRVVLSNSVGFADYMGLGDKVIGFYPLAKLIAATILKPNRANKRVEDFFRHTLHNRTLAIEPEFIEYFYETMSASHNLLFISRLTQLTKRLILIDQLSKVKNQAMVVWGENDSIMPLGRNEGSFYLIPQAEVHIVKEAGHFPSIEKAAEFNSIVANFLNT